MLNNRILYIRGGLGDFLQYYDYIINNPSEQYLIHMHYKNAKLIFDQLGIYNCFYYEFENIFSLAKQTEFIVKNLIQMENFKIYETPRAFYSKFNFGIESNLTAENLVNSFSNKKPIIGIHPFRSSFANSVYEIKNLPARIIPLSITKKIINNNNNYLIYGSKKELLEYGMQQEENIKFVCFDNILDSLSTVKYCSSLIGLDSCFKSMSSMQKINTLCIIADCEDEIRDSMFIKKYEEDKVMKVFKTKNIEQNQNEIIDFIKNNI